MLDNKPLEIRDIMTCIPALAIRMAPTTDIEAVYLRRYGFQLEYPTIVLMNLENQKAQSDPYAWNDRTYQTAHLHIQEYYESLQPGQVVDVRTILYEAVPPASPEIYPKIQPLKAQ